MQISTDDKLEIRFCFNMRKFSYTKISDFESQDLTSRFSLLKFKMSISSLGY